MKSQQDLKNQLMSINRKGYPAYKSLKGQYNYGSYILSIDHVQGDPYAAPSRLRIIIPHGKALFPAELYDLPHKRTALEDYLLRLFYTAIGRCSYKAAGSGKSGMLSVSRCGQEVLERTACHFYPDRIEVRLDAGFPANGRTINAPELERMLCELLPPCVHSVFYYSRLDKQKIDNVIHLAIDQEAVRSELDSRKLAAFIADGSILPRENGISSLPLKDAVPFYSPGSLAVTLHLPHRGTIRGMGIPRGITLIIGGGYHGKSTLLKALENGVYNHIAGDGREYVITSADAVKIRAEDGRSIRSVNISPFINNLPNGKDTRCFTTGDASGSTSQAAGIAEAAESGSRLLLMDEDTCAANFMVRDELMQKIISRDREPITPFLETALPLYEHYGISTILAAGSSGAYFHIAGTIIMMDSYTARDITADVKKALPGKDKDSVILYGGNRPLPDRTAFKRIIKPSVPAAEERSRIKLYGNDSFEYNKDSVELRYLEQIADAEQTAALGYLLKYILEKLADGRKTISQLIREADSLIGEHTMTILADGPYLSCGLARPRVQEIHACLNRYRKLNIV